MKTREGYIEELKSIDYSNTCYTQECISKMQNFSKKLINIICELDGQIFGDVDYKKEFNIKFNKIIIGHNSLTVMVDGESSVREIYLLGMLYKATGNGWGTGVYIGYEW